MFSFTRTLEIFLFALCNFAPYVFLSIYAFQKHLRFSKKVTWILCIPVVLVQFATRYISALQGFRTNIFMSMIRLLIFLAVYAILIDQIFRKILFLELIFANLGNFILIAATCLERNLFPNLEHAPYCWHSSVIMLLFHLLITLPLTYAIKNYFIPMLDNHHVGKEWNYYWIVPFIFYIIWQYQINIGTDNSLRNMENPSNVVFLFIINIGSIFIYYLMLLLDGQMARNLELETSRYYKNIEYLEYQTLEERIQEARRARHDLRHHMTLLSEYVEAGEYEKAKEYLRKYRVYTPNEQAISFCEHHTINALLLHFAHLALDNEIDYRAEVSVPEQLNIPDTELVVLLGNLLENALDACSKQTSTDRRIKIKGRYENDYLYFTIDNSYSNTIRKNEKGDFLSTKKFGSGIGMKSAKQIVERRNGVFSAEHKDGMFYVSFMLNA